VGIWQFVRGTARGKLAMELEYDERRDPWRSTEAAAALLAQNYAELGTWPLAITAYNHGTNGMKRAVRTLSTQDLGKITTQYQSRLFGFASRNFYAEFIAAASLYENRDRHFPDLVAAPPWSFDELVTDRYVSVGELARQASAPLDALRELNPALATEVWSDHLFVPQGYRLRVPAGQGEAFQTAYAGLPEDAKSAHQVGLYYKVRSGDTLGTIAAKFGSSVSELQRANGIANPHRIRQGQSLLIPPGRGRASQVSAAGSATHVVRRGETLAGIARRYGTSVAALMAVNSISGSLILPAQVLVIP